MREKRGEKTGYGEEETMKGREIRRRRRRKSVGKGRSDEEGMEWEKNRERGEQE